MNLITDGVNQLFVSVHMIGSMIVMTSSYGNYVHNTGKRSNSNLRFHGIMDQLITDFLEDVLHPCHPGNHGDTSEYNPVDHMSELMENVRLIRRHNVDRLLSLYDDRSVMLPRDQEATDFTWPVPSVSILLNKYHNLTVMAFMLRVTSLEEHYRYGDNTGFYSHYEVLYNRIIQVLCELQRWLTYKGRLPNLEVIQGRIVNAMNKKYSLPPYRHVQELEERRRIDLLKQSLINLYLDLEYIHQHGANK